MIIFDEAQLTTGATIDRQEDGNFVRVRSDEVFDCDKRLNLTATSWVYGIEA